MGMQGIDGGIFTRLQAEEDLALEKTKSKQNCQQ